VHCSLAHIEAFGKPHRLGPVAASSNKNKYNYTKCSSSQSMCDGSPHLRAGCTCSTDRAIWRVWGVPRHRCFFRKPPVLPQVPAFIYCWLGQNLQFTILWPWLNSLAGVCSQKFTKKITAIKKHSTVRNRKSNALILTVEVFFDCGFFFLVNFCKQTPGTYLHHTVSMVRSPDPDLLIFPVPVPVPWFPVIFKK
jgi:hypothetical protein